MEIIVDRKWKLTTDKTGWEVQQLRALTKGPKKGEVTWASEGHYDTIKWALVGLFKLMLHEGEGTADLLMLAKRIEEAEERILQAAQLLQPRIPEPVQPQVRKRPSEVVPISPWDRTG